MTNHNTDALEDAKPGVKVKLAALWTAMMFLYVYADVLSLFRPGQLDEMAQGRMGPLQVNQGSLVSASIVVMIPAIMGFLSLILKPTVSRWANIILGALFTLVNISNLVGETWAYYLLFGIAEVVLTLLIIGYAWTWPRPEQQGSNGLHGPALARREREPQVEFTR